MKVRAQETEMDELEAWLQTAEEAPGQDIPAEVTRQMLGQLGEENPGDFVTQKDELDEQMGASGLVRRGMRVAARFPRLVSG